MLRFTLKTQAEWSDDQETWCGLLPQLDSVGKPSSVITSHRAGSHYLTTSGCPCCLITHQNCIVRSCDTRLMRCTPPSRKRSCTCAAAAIGDDPLTCRTNPQRGVSPTLCPCKSMLSVVWAEKPRRGKVKKGQDKSGKGQGKHDKASGSGNDGQGKPSPSTSRYLDDEWKWGHKRADCRKRIKDESGAALLVCSSKS